jgi:hypothetical protein
VGNAVIICFFNAAPVADIIFRNIHEPRKETMTKNHKKQPSSAAKQPVTQPKDAAAPRKDTAGDELFTWCDTNYDLTGAEPVVKEMCELADRLEQVRNKLKETPDPKLIGAEVKLSASFMRCWKAAGFGDANKPPARPVGRPEGSQSERQKRGI